MAPEHQAPELTVATCCPICDRDIEIGLEGRPSADRLRPVTIACPYCGESASIETGRRLLWVATATKDEPPS